ncbi:Serine/threonine-protein kinase tel1 [Kalmusia sp. IMI 367209]|nr:Serine/threonine-protein kinase tel1 [Kalmusia sp. IMI 367209]
MGATNIQDAKVLISSTKVADRLSGLKDLNHILKYNDGNTSLESVTNKAYLALFETLFQCMRDERSSYLHPPKSKTTKTPREILSHAAKAVRGVINSAVHIVKSSTVELVVQSILELLPGRDGKLLEPLVENLPKALKTLLEYQPHVERMSQDCWEDSVNFCIESLSTIFSELEDEPQDSWGTASSSRARTPLESTDGAPKATPRETLSRSRYFPKEQTQAAEDLIHCLHLLVKASNAPLMASVDAILETLINFLRKKMGRGNAAALAAINAILPRIVLPRSQLSEQVIRSLLPLLRFMWSDLALRDELLITLTYTEAHLRHLLIHDRDDALSLNLEALVETLYTDYKRRQETTAHQFLEESHLCFRKVGGGNTNPHPQATNAFSSNIESARDEGLWATVATIARLSAMLDNRKRRLAHNRESDDQIVWKRPRLTHNFDEYLRNVLEPRSNAKRSAMQVLAFMVQEGPLDEQQIQALLEKLTIYISDENPVHSSWAMVALAA